MLADAVLAGVRIVACTVGLAGQIVRHARVLRFCWVFHYADIEVEFWHLIDLARFSARLRVWTVKGRGLHRKSSPLCPKGMCP